MRQGKGKQQHIGTYATAYVIQTVFVSLQTAAASHGGQTEATNDRVPCQQSMRCALQSSRV